MIGRIIWLLGLAALVSSFSAGGVALPDDGWARWQTDSVQDAPSWCCYAWERPGHQPIDCSLDDDRMRFSSATDSPPTDRINVFVHQRDGRIVDARAYAADCPVGWSEEPIDLGSLDSNQSVGVLASAAVTTSRVERSIVPVIAAHEGGAARRFVKNAAFSDGPWKPRKAAIFWVGQLRSHDLGHELVALMREDPEVYVRKHAAFSLSQSSVVGRSRFLAELGAVDRSADVRSEAWFWFAQVAADHAEQTLAQALQTEDNQHVREKILLSLLQLPNDRGTRILVDLVRNAETPKLERHKSLFWLAQSGSPLAIELIDELLAPPSRAP